MCDDTALEVVWEARERLLAAGLRPAFSFARAPSEVIDKREQARAARRAGVDAPWTEWGDAGELAARADSFEYPVLVKPAVSHAGVKEIGGKALRCETLAELRAGLSAHARLRRHGAGFRAGRRRAPVHGRRVFRGGGRTLVFTGRKLKQHPPTLGISRLSEALEVPDLVDDSVRLLRSSATRGWRRSSTSSTSATVFTV